MYAILERIESHVSVYECKCGSISFDFVQNRLEKV